MSSVASLASTAAVTAAPAPAVRSLASLAPATSKGGECSFPELAAKFASIYRRWREQTVRDAVRRDRFDTLLAAATGTAKGYRPGRADPGSEEFYEVLRRISDEDPDDDPTDKYGTLAWDEIHDELFPVVNAMLDQPARSLADVMLQAQAIALANHEFWTVPGWAEGAHGALDARILVDSICRFCGVDPLPGIEVVPLAEARKRIDAVVTGGVA